MNDFKLIKKKEPLIKSYDDKNLKSFKKNDHILILSENLFTNIIL